MKKYIWSVLLVTVAAIVVLAAIACNMEPKVTTLTPRQQAYDQKMQDLIKSCNHTVAINEGKDLSDLKDYEKEDLRLCLEVVKTEKELEELDSFSEDLEKTNKQFEDMAENQKKRPIEPPLPTK